MSGVQYIIQLLKIPKRKNRGDRDEAKESYIRLPGRHCT